MLTGRSLPSISRFHAFVHAHSRVRATPVQPHTHDPTLHSHTSGITADIFRRGSSALQAPTTTLIPCQLRIWAKPVGLLLTPVAAATAATTAINYPPARPVSGYLFEETSLEYRKGSSWNYTLEEGNIKGMFVSRIARTRIAASATGSQSCHRSSFFDHPHRSLLWVLC